MNFDRSAVSLKLNWVMLTKLTGCRTSTNKTCDIQGRAIFGRKRHNLNKLGRGSQDDATNIIQGSRPSGFRQEDIFFIFFYVFGHRGIT